MVYPNHTIFVFNELLFYHPNRQHQQQQQTLAEVHEPFQEEKILSELQEKLEREVQHQLERQIPSHRDLERKAVSRIQKLQQNPTTTSLTTSTNNSPRNCDENGSSCSHTDLSNDELTVSEDQAESDKKG